MSDFRTVPAFVLVDADTNLGADLILSDDRDALEADPRVSIADRHYGVSIGLSLSDLRRLVLAVEQAADRHTGASQEARLITTPPTPPVERADYIVMLVPNDPQGTSRVVNQWTATAVGEEAKRLETEVAQGVYTGLDGRLSIYRVVEPGVSYGVSSADAEVRA